MNQRFSLRIVTVFIASLIDILRIKKRSSCGYQCPTVNRPCSHLSFSLELDILIFPGLEYLSASLVTLIVPAPHRLSSSQLLLGIHMSLCFAKSYNFSLLIFIIFVLSKIYFSDNNLIMVSPPPIPYAFKMGESPEFASMLVRRVVCSTFSGRIGGLTGCS